MFLSRLLSRNPELPAAAIRLHQAGALLANTYLLDIDTFAMNAQVLADAAAAAGVTPYFMAKQYGRNPDASQAIVPAIRSAVCVDLQDLEAHVRGHVPVGHVGHLVQPHRGAEAAVLAARPEVVTVFDDSHAERLSTAATAAGATQEVLLRVRAPGDRFYFGHGGGFALEEVEDAARRVGALPRLRVAGVTTFPCLLADAQSRSVQPTPNLSSLTEAARRLRAAGVEVRQVNAPGTTSAGTMRLLADRGATHVEPGNALHGTTPLHVLDPAAPELPAIVYVSEVSHLDGDDAYVYAAGYYIDRVLGDYRLQAVCGRDERALDRRFHVDAAPPDAIHYYCILRETDGQVRPGDTVVFCFRPQVFVTRARTQAIRGLHTGGDPYLLTRYDVDGRPVEGVS